MVSTKHDYLARCRAGIARYKFFDEAPTPELLREAQVKCGELRLPIPRDEKGDVLPYPSVKSKADIFNLEQYKEIDDHALRAPNSLHTVELPELVKYLLKPAHNDVAKVRVIFRWISGQDLLRYKLIPGAPRDSAAMYLNELKQNKGSYESLFRQMCTYAGIPCEKITGYAKGVSYKVGEDVLENARNTWNAVLVDNTWRLIDMQWASRQVVTQDQGEWELIDDGTGAKPAKSDDADVSYDIYAYEEFYFLCDPEEFIYSHFPDEEVWQLLARPVTFSEFNKIAYLRSKFFELNLTVISHPWCVLQAVSGEANLDLGYRSETMKFSYNLYRSTKVEHKQIQGNQDMDKFLFLDAVPDEKTLSMEIFFPTTGKFKAELFGRDMTESDTVLKWLCTYVFYCESPKTDCRPLPQNPRKEWGPGSDTISMGMEPLTHKRGKINVDDGEVEVKFALKEDRDFLHKLTTEDNKTLENYTVHHIENGEVVFHARVPGKGQYMLSIMAKEDDEQGGYPSVCNYLLRCEEEFPPLEPFPEIPNGELGPTDEFKRLKLELLDGCHSMITVDKSGHITFKIKIPKDVEFFAKLGLQTPNGVEDKSEYVSWYREGEIVTFDLRFAQKGSYRFNLFAKPAGQPGGFPRAFSSIIEVPIPMMVSMSFPEKYAGWSDDCKLIEPFNKDIAAKENMEFAAVVPAAKAVAVVGDEWTQLKKDNDGVWRNSVYTIEEGKPMFLSAKFDAEGNSFSHLLKYNVVPKSQIEEMAREQSRAHHEAEKEYEERQKMKEELKKKGEEKRKNEALEKKRRMELQVMEDVERKQLDERFDFEDSGKGDSATANRLEEERKKREEDRKRRVQEIKQRDEEIIKKRDFPRSAMSDSPWKGRGSKSPDDLRKELKVAQMSKNKDGLEKIITECEQYAYPELGSDLREARDTLESIGGGRGGSKSPDVLRKKLDDAMRRKDKRALDNAIRECVAAGMPSLDDAIQKARTVSDILGGGAGDIKSSETLKKKLADAIKSKDIDSLQKAIQDAEDAGYPELGAQLRKARDTLEALGGGRGGSKTAESLRAKLQDAINQNDRNALESIIEECIASGMPELDSDIQQAQESMDSIQDLDDRPPKEFRTFSPRSLRAQMQKAMDSRDKAELERLIDIAEEAEYPELGLDLRKARETLECLGVGRGGTKSPEALIRKLQEAIKRKDKRALDKAIKECVAAGLPELDDAIHKARSISDILLGGTGDVATSESLRSRLSDAIASEDIDSLEKAIEDAEVAGYPELASDLLNARDTLLINGGGRGGSKTPEGLREKLKAAMKTGNKEDIEDILDQCVAAGMPELEHDIQWCRRTLDQIEELDEHLHRGSRSVSPDTLRCQIREASKSKDKEAIERLIDDAETAKYPELRPDLREARQSLESLGGGQGGTKSPDALIKKLEDAIRRKDKRALDRAIRECVASALPELDDAIHKARAISDILGGGTGDIVSADTLREELADAISSKDIDSLEKAISDAEAAGYPELGSDLRKARDSLDALGGGRGGSKTPDVLKDKLREAMRKGDKDAIETILDECIAAGMPELNNDIYRARKALGEQEELDDHYLRGSRSVTPEVLREQIRRASKANDKEVLERLINETEAAGYPELATDLRKARESLENLGGGRGGTKSPDALMKKLEDAIRRKDKRALDRAIKDCVAAGLPGLDDAIQKARKISDILGGGSGDVVSADTLREELADAISSKDIDSLETAIADAEAAGYPELGSELRKARDTLDALGGGRGGSKTPDVLKDKLREAMRTGDKDALEAVLDECIAAGMPELDADIYRARRSLDEQEELDNHFHRGSRSVTPDVLRDQLRRASKASDKEDLERLIDEAEASGYPELATDLRGARKSLEGLGGGRGGTVSSDVLINKLQDAIKRKDKAALDRAIRECVAAGLPELDDVIHKAREFSDIMKGGSGDIVSADALRDELADAISSKDIDSLEKAIADAEEAGYPELGSELRKARDTLEKLGGGRGGSKTPDVLKDKLREAMRSGDQDALEAILDECVAAGMPELDADIHRARKSLEDQEDGRQRRGSRHLSPDSLRDQMRRASRTKNKENLERLIDEAEEAGYPELGSDLREARRSLEGLGGGRGGTKSPDALKKKLEDAIRRKDKRALDKAIKECVAAGLPGLENAIQKARKISDILGGGSGDIVSTDSLREELADAITSKDIDSLEKAIADAEAAGYPELGSDLRKARDTLDKLGGGRGGSKTPDVLKDKLRQAMRGGDVDTLEAVLDECIAAGMPELDADIHRARHSLDNQEEMEERQRRGSRSLSPGSIRDKMRRASKLKDKEALQILIDEAEDAGYPELSSDLREARKSLESLGGGRGGTKSSDDLKKKLDDAIKRKDKRALDRAIKECVAAGLPELDDTIHKARKISDILGGGSGDIATSDTIRDELTEAIRSKDIDKLEKAIEDAEAAGYPELGAKLHKARDTLDALGGGRGGSKTPDILKEKLREAMRKGDKDILEAVLDECVAAGMPELDSDICTARKSLDEQEELDERKRRGSLSPDTLRDQMRKASRIKDKEGLARLIDEAEAAGYPELGSDLREARKSLESLGGGRGGIKSPDALVKKLEDAIRRKDKRALDKAIKECVTAGLPELDDAVQKARRISDIIGGGTGDVVSADALRDELMDAIKSKDIDSLEKAITDAEAAGYPELGSDLRKARDTLDKLGGGRGGCKTPDVLKEKLRQAMRQGDSDALESVLDECIASGMPELDADIHRARKSLDDQEKLDERQRKGSRSLSPDTLRDQMRRASRSKDKTGLERLIDEAEASEYPELGPDLCEARKSLENLGGGRGGTKSPDALIKKLEDAIRRKDKRALDRAIKECVASGLPELDDAVQKAREYSDILSGRKGDVPSADEIYDELTDAIKSKDIDKLAKAIEDAEEAGYPELGSRLRKARDTLEKLGGGRRGSKTPDVLKDKLREAMRAGDQDALETVLDECIAAGMPELDADINSARKSLDDQKRLDEKQRRGSRSLSPDTLRDQIRRASKAKDKEALQTLIDEAEEAGYPELGSDLREARKSLESFGGGRGGTKSPDALIKKLEDAIRRKDKRALDRAIKECVASGLPELDDAVHKARKFSDILSGGKGDVPSADEIYDELTDAIKSKDIDKLAKAIEDAEEAGYPELGSRLRKARDTLEKLGGGRRGSKTPDVLKDKLREAMRTGDKDTLEAVLDECVAAGMPELDADINRARKSLEDQENLDEPQRRGSRSLSPDTLRDQIRRASRPKDKEGLQIIIDEAEEAGYPELGSDLREARKSLESLGGGRGGTKSPDALIKKLEDAIRRKDKRALDRAIKECVASGLPELDDAVHKARKFSDILSGGKGEIPSADKIYDDLNEAIKSKDIDKLEKAIEDAEEAGYPELASKMRKARDTLDKLAGGRRGSKTPDVLKSKLRDAIRKGDKDTLEAVLDECVAAGMPELDGDIRRARKSLDEREKLCEQTRRGSRSLSPDTLRDQMRRASRSKDKEDLERLIDEAETAGYPELGSDLREARKSLESLGGGRGGTKSPEALAKKLKDAIKRKDKRALDKAIRECVASGLPGLDDTLQKARKVSHILGGGEGDIMSQEELHDELTDAIRSKDIDKLEKAIEAAEAAGYPELGSKLRKARDTLDKLGGGRGGSKTPDILKDKLREAMRKGDKDTLEAVLDECIAAGMPELDADIHRARKSLDDQEQLDDRIRRGSRSVTPERLREEIRRASRTKDKRELERLISDAEAAGYPEIASDLQDARKSLQSLGGKGGGSKSPDALVKKLEDAMKNKDKRALDRAIRECVSAGLPELEDAIQKSRRFSDMLGGGTGDIVSAGDLRDELTEAIKSQDIESLEQAIADAEAAGYPELGSDLAKARDALEILGGGRGGSKTPDAMRIKLRDAVRKGDKDELESVLDEAVAAGMPELDADIYRARKSLDDQDSKPGSRRESKTPDTLRDQLRRASRLRDRAALEKLIDEAEQEGYPELGTELSKARDTLESLGGGRGGSKTPDILQQNLEEAMRQNDKDALDRAIRESVAAGMPELRDSIQKARRLSDILGGGTGEVKSPDVISDQLKKAVRRKDIASLEKAIADAEAAGYPEVATELRKARDTLENLGGGRGGSKTPEILREKLRETLRKGSKDDLQKVIDECVAAGMPELDSEIEIARGSLDETENGFRRESISPDTLRDQLRRASRQRDKTELERLIDEAEDAEYPELGHDLRKARETLESLGGGRGGSKSPEVLRDKLKDAIRRKDKTSLNKAISECVAAGLPELDDDIQKARRTSDIIRGGTGEVKSPEVLRDQIKMATRKKDKDALDAAITEAEIAGYPELGSDLRKARDTLENLGGGRGVDKSSDVLRDQLKTAIKQNDKAALQRAIEEAEHAGLPELAYDLRKAKDSLDKLGGGRGGSVSPDSLRDKLKRAMKLKDKQGLEKAIEECVASGHPELLADVQQARDTLDSIGGGRKASKPTDVLRDQLKAAMKSKHPASLERAIAEAEASKDPQLMAEVQSAKKMLDAVWPARAGTPEEVRNLRAKLESAMRRDDTAEMQRIMMEIEQKNLSDYLTVEVGDARNMLRGQQGRGQQDPEGLITRTDTSAESAFASRFGQYTQYGTMSHDLLIAALVVIGESERRLGNWKSFQHFFEMSQADGSTRRVLGLDLEHIYQDLSARADEILNRHSTDEVHLLNRSGMMSYSWSRLMNQEMVSHFSSFNSSNGRAGSSSSSSSSSYTEGAAHMSQTTSRTEYQTHSGSRVQTSTAMGPTTTSSSYQFSQGSRRDGPTGGSGGGFTSYTTSSKYTSGPRRF